MSFSDLLSSSKGPGVIGLLMALLVLVGFGALAMLSSDADGQGKSLSWVIRQNSKHIENETYRLDELREQIESVPERKRMAQKLRTIRARIKFLDTEIPAQVLNFETASNQYSELEERFFDYKNKYRAFVRDNAEDTEIAELKTNSGEVYVDVNIRKVTPVGIELRHRDGLKRIPFEELPLEMQDYYQFDKNQKKSELKREMEMLRRHNKAVGIAQKNAAATNARKKAERASEERENIRAEIAMKERKIRQIQSEISSLNETITQMAASHSNSTGLYRNRLASKQRQLAGVRAELLKLDLSL